MRSLPFEPLEVVSEAMRIRKFAGANSGDAICPPDIAELLKIEVRFVDIPSLEGMYMAGEAPTIVLPASRPAGRRNFTCAHELGHHVLGHGSVLDEILVEAHMSYKDPKEIAADMFAAHLLMPRSLLLRALRDLPLDASSTPIQMYELSSWLGVGYATLLSHLTFGLRLLSREKYDQLRRVTPKAIRSQLLGAIEAGNLIVVTTQWSGRPIDCEVGDYIALPSETLIEGDAIQKADSRSGLHLAIAKEPGTAHVTLPAADLDRLVRVSRYEYVGRNRFRFEKEIADD